MILREDVEWTPTDKHWAIRLIERLPCHCAVIGDGEWVECERCDFLRKFGFVTKGG